jgi:predicted membrane chloride channel (bestrophin family)
MNLTSIIPNPGVLCPNISTGTSLLTVLYIGCFVPTCFFSVPTSFVSVYPRVLFRCTHVFCFSVPTYFVSPYPRVLFLCIHVFCFYVLTCFVSVYLRVRNKTRGYRETKLVGTEKQNTRVQRNKTRGYRETKHVGTQKQNT